MPPGKEPIMMRATALIACLFAAGLAWASAAVAGPGTELPAPIDWRDFVDHGGEGDHVVGEDMCARPNRMPPS
jgi:hypothetical protein